MAGRQNSRRDGLRRNRPNRPKTRRQPLFEGEGAGGSLVTRSCSTGPEGCLPFHAIIARLPKPRNMRPAKFGKICSDSNQQLLDSLLSVRIGKRREVFTKREQAIALKPGCLFGESLRSENALMRATAMEIIRSRSAIWRAVRIF
jgi:hypothetical protein